MVVCFFARCCSTGAILSAAGGHICLATDDRLDSLPLHRVVKRNCAIHIAVICHSARIHAEFLHACGERIDLNGAVEKAVVSMKMQVNEIFVSHDYEIVERRTCRNFCALPGDSTLYHAALRIK